MNRPIKICIVHKKSFFELHRASFDKIKNAAFRKKILESHIEHNKTLKTVLDIIKEKGVKHKVLYRGQLRRLKKLSGFDLVIAVGGDGTLFEASRHMKDTPLMLVNSDTKNSRGYFASSDRFGFKNVFKKYMAGKLKKIKLPRLEIRINTKLVEDSVINDILFANKVPSLATKYILRIGRRAEPQKSSGVWIATAGGSTGAISSAGGIKMKLTRRGIQFLVREPLAKESLRLINKIVNNKIEIISNISNSMLYIDGLLQSIPVKIGDRIEIRLSKNYSNLFGFGK